MGHLDQDGLKSQFMSHFFLKSIEPVGIVNFTYFTSRQVPLAGFAL